MFDVNVEGTTSFRDIDVFARGAPTALMLAAPAVSDGTVDVTFVAGVQNPTVSAIEVVTTASAVPPLLAASPSTLAFPDARVRQTTTQDVADQRGHDRPLTVSSTAISGPDGALFADRFDDSSPVVLGPGESTTVEVAFLPTATGTRRCWPSRTRGRARRSRFSFRVPRAPRAAGWTHRSVGRCWPEPVNRADLLQFGPDGRLYGADGRHDQGSDHRPR